MSRRVNVRGWIVIESIASRDGMLCVDLFEHPDGGFGFEHFRAEPEDSGRWTAIGGFSARRFDSLVEAVHACQDTIGWLAGSQGWPAAVARMGDA